MKVPIVSKEVWQELYGAARDFRNVECWDWMSDSDIFGFLNPESGEIGYCCVLGAFGEVFGLVVYLGTEGSINTKPSSQGRSDPMVTMHPFMLYPGVVFFLGNERVCPIRMESRLAQEVSGVDRKPRYFAR